MAITVISLAGLTNLFSVVMLSSLFSFLMATVFVTLDAVDVAMTEASVGAGISTVLFLCSLYLINKNEIKSTKRSILPIFIATFVGFFLIWGMLGLPVFGDPAAVIHQHVAPRYLKDGFSETGIPNIVTAILASYRGFDTLGEIIVIFTAGVGLMALLRKKS
jgi:multicomponent Na+:H+ antiporter subunit B